MNLPTWLKVHLHIQNVASTKTLSMKVGVHTLAPWVGLKQTLKPKKRFNTGSKFYK
jgi:hypothetical protein